MLNERIWVKIHDIILLYYWRKNPIGWKSIGRLLPKREKTIAKAFKLHDGIKKYETRVIQVVWWDRPTHDSMYQWNKCGN